MSTKAELSDELLRETYARIRRPHWPATFEEAMSWVITAAVVRTHARLALRGVKVDFDAPRGVIKRTNPSPRTPPRKLREKWAGIDMKRQASGDFDDKE